MCVCVPEGLYKGLHCAKELDAVTSRRHHDVLPLDRRTHNFFITTIIISCIKMFRALNRFAIERPVIFWSCVLGGIGNCKLELK